MLYCIEHADGDLSIMRIVRDDATLADELAKQPDDFQASVTATHELADEQLPLDETFRAAWRWDGAAIVIDMQAATTIWQQRIQMACDAAVADLNAASAAAVPAALLSGDMSALQSLQNQKAAIQALPSAYDLSHATTPALLKAFWPAQLSGYEP